MLLDLCLYHSCTGLVQFIHLREHAVSTKLQNTEGEDLFHSRMFSCTFDATNPMNFGLFPVNNTNYWQSQMRKLKMQDNCERLLAKKFKTYLFWILPQTTGNQHFRYQSTPNEKPARHHLLSFFSVKPKAREFMSLYLIHCCFIHYVSLTSVWQTSCKTSTFHKK